MLVGESQGSPAWYRGPSAARIPLRQRSWHLYPGWRVCRFYRARSYGLPYAASASAPGMQIRSDMAALQKA